MAKNILGMVPFCDSFYSVALENLRKTLSSNESIDNIEIEFKYAEFRRFSIEFDERLFRDASNPLKERIYQHYTYQYNEFFRSLC
jgi:hypothetical protein